MGIQQKKELNHIQRCMILIHNPLGIALLHIFNDNEVMKENDLIP
jgi:hypothetical protein